MTRAAIAPSDVVAINAVLVAARQAADVICDRWTLALVVAAFLGETRFSGLMERTGMASRLLTTRLRALERNGILIRMPFSMHPVRNEYRLTNKGLDLFNVFIQMVRWEQNWDPNFPAGPINPVHAPCGARLCPELRCRACGKLATARDIVLKVSRAQLQHMPTKQTVHRRSTINSDRQGASRSPLGPSLDTFGDKWGIEILICAFFGIRRFNDFRVCTGISTNILTDRLGRLIGSGILRRDEEPTRRPGYRLTEKGIDLYGVLVALQDWADFWLRRRYRSPVRLIHRDCGKIFQPQATCANCGRPAPRTEVEFRAR